MCTFESSCGALCPSLVHLHHHFLYILLTTQASLGSAWKRVCMYRIPGGPLGTGLVFAMSHHCLKMDALGDQQLNLLHPPHLIGCDMTRAFLLRSPSTHPGTRAHGQVHQDDEPWAARGGAERRKRDTAPGSVLRPGLCCRVLGSSAHSCSC